MRVFAGLPLPQDAKTFYANIIEEIRKKYKRLNFVKPEGIHITVHFFGDLKDDQTAQVIKAMEKAELAVGKIKVESTKLGQFPTRGNPRVVFADLSVGRDSIESVCKIFKQAVKSFPFVIDDDHPFSPHITLARNKTEKIDLNYINNYPGFSFSYTLDRLVLYSSVLSRSGAEYTPLKTILFK